MARAIHIAVLAFAAAAFLAAMVPMAHAQGGIFVQRLPIFPNDADYRLPFDQVSNFTGGTIARNSIGLSNVTTPQAIFTIGPCGILSPHFHPRGTEQLFIVSGTAEVVILLEDPVTPIRRVPLVANQAVILPAGSVHYTRNTNSYSSLVMVQTFDNPLPGTIFISNTLATFAKQQVDANVFNTALPGLNLKAGWTPAPTLFILPC